MMAIGLIAVLAITRTPVLVDPAAPSDCGPMALALLLRLEGFPGDARSIASHLPPRDPRGFSMLELREAAGPLGLKLTGVEIGRGDPTPDRPILALLDKKPDGHFVVVRPVGRTGKLVQVIDPVGRLEVLDASALYASPDWTGLALIPTRPNWPLRVGFGAGVGALLGLTWLLALKVRSPGRGG